MEGRCTGCSAADMRKGGQGTGQRRASGVCLGMIELGRGGKTAGVRTLRARVWRNLDGLARHNLWPTRWQNGERGTHHHDIAWDASLLCGESEGTGVVSFREELKKKQMGIPVSRASGIQYNILAHRDHGGGIGGSPRALDGL